MLKRFKKIGFLRNLQHRNRLGGMLQILQNVLPNLPLTVTTGTKKIKGAITGTAGFFAGNMAADGVALAEGLAGLLTHAIGSEAHEL